MTDVFVAETPFATRNFGAFRLLVTDRSAVGGQDVVLVKGSVAGQRGVLCRVTSRCMMSTAFDADDCDCAEQIELTLALLHKRGRGILIYLDQEGRGHGLPAKVRAMNLKAKGFDTFTAFEEMSMEPDVTDYRHVPDLLLSLAVDSIVLLSNNPAKRKALEAAGVIVEGSELCLPPNIPDGAVRHLKAKKLRGHNIHFGKGR